MKNKLLGGSLAVAGAALLWSLDGTFLRPNLYTLPSPLVVFLEHLLGLVVLAPFLWVYRSQIKTIAKKQWAAIFWVALFGGALGTTFITKALFLTGFHDISVVILLQKFQPIFAILLAAAFVGERFPKKFYWFAALAVAAGYFVTFKDPFTITNLPRASYLVPAFALLAAFAWGSSTAFGKYSVRGIHYGLLAALRFGLTVVIMAVPALYFYGASIAAVSGRQWGTLVAIVFTSGALAMYLYYYGLKKIPASIATLCELAWPVSAIVFDYFFNHNVLSWTQLIGAAVLIYAVYRAVELNRPRVIAGAVIAGDGMGASIGAATANLPVELARGMAKGLYLCEVEADGKNYSGLLFFGLNSLSGKDCLEAHLRDFSGNLNGHKITIRTTGYLRLPKKFASTADLSAQIKNDIARAEAGRE